MTEYARFLWRCFRLSFVGGWRYHVWMLVLTAVAVGFHRYFVQVRRAVLQKPIGFHDAERFPDHSSFAAEAGDRSA